MFRNPLTDAIVALVVLLLIFGPKRLPGLGRSLGQGIREFKDSIGGGSSDADDQPAMIPAQTSAATPAPTVTQARATTSEK